MQLRTLSILALAALLGACGGNSNGTPDGGVDDVALARLYVDALNGSDANGGSADAPFQTIGAALAAAVPGDVIQLAPGTYGPGESFPMTIPPGVSLQGATDGNPDTAAAYLILGDLGLGGSVKPQKLQAPVQSVGLILETGATLSGVAFTFAVMDPVKPAAIHMSGDDTSILGCLLDEEVTGGMVMVWITGMDAQVRNTRILGNASTGIHVGGPGAAVEACEIGATQYAVDCAFPFLADLGGGGASTGGNTLVGQHAVRVGIVGMPTAPLHAQNNLWTAVPPTILHDDDESTPIAQQIVVEYVESFPLDLLVIHTDGAALAP